MTVTSIFYSVCDFCIDKAHAVTFQRKKTGMTQKTFYCIQYEGVKVVSLYVRPGTADLSRVYAASAQCQLRKAPAHF